MYKPEKTNPQKEPCSLVVCVKNGIDHLDDFFAIIQAQGITEIIVVDDFSIDGTLEKLQEYTFPNLRIVQCTENKPGKKQAMQMGIAHATYNRILCIDIDCRPDSPQWAQTINTVHSPIVLGYGPMKKGKTLVQVFARYETFMTAVQYLSYALAGIPYMGVGRNMLMDRSLREEHKIKGQHLPSGDDDLSVNAFANSANTKICIAPESFVYSDSKDTWAGFFRQKTRHITTSIHYKMAHKILLAGWSASQITIYLLLIVGILCGTITSPQAFIALLSKWIIQMMVLFPIAKKLKEKDLVWKVPLLDGMLFLYYMSMPFLLLTVKKEKTWS